MTVLSVVVLVQVVTGVGGPRLPKPIPWTVRISSSRGALLGRASSVLSPSAFGALPGGLGAGPAPGKL